MPTCAMSSDHSDIPQFLQSIFSTSELGFVTSEVTSEVKCKTFCSFYRALDHEMKSVFLSQLTQFHGTNQNVVVQGANLLVSSQERGEAHLLKSMERLHLAMIPRYQHLLQQIGRIEDGVKFLVDMRADILNCLTKSTSELETVHLQMLNRILRDLLTLWFGVGCLELERVTWMSPCDIVQKISEYEAVQPIRNWSDLKKRVGSYRRCYVFTHSSMPREPVVVLHAALTNKISSSIHSIIQNPTFQPNIPEFESANSEQPTESIETEDPSQISAVVFYSITSTQRGLQGVQLGNYLVKRVIRELQSEFPHITQFSSLSPIPGFRDWLLSQISLQLHRCNVGEEDTSQCLLTPVEIESMRAFHQANHSSTLETFKQLVQTHQWITREASVQAMKRPLLRLCARYLYLEKQRGFVLNPVANFHLTNGAVLWRINHLADMSGRGLTQSCGLMVNYFYYLSDTESNSIDYLQHGRIAVSPAVLELVRDTTDFVSSPSSPFD